MYMHITIVFQVVEVPVYYIATAAIDTISIYGSAFCLITGWCVCDL